LHHTNPFPTLPRNSRKIHAPLKGANAMKSLDAKARQRLDIGLRSAIVANVARSKGPFFSTVGWLAGERLKIN
jgi:hypothetical protein